METKDLRLGNLVISKFNNIEEIGIVTGIPDNNGCLDVNEVGYIIEDCKPIPLTEEWLMELGGEKTMYQILIGDYAFDLKRNEFYKWNHYDSVVGEHSTVVNNIKYVHQLQNLYFALTGQELEIKLNK